MASPSLLEFVPSPDVVFFSCGSCRAHIASFKDFIFPTFPWGLWYNEVVFRATINLLVLADPAHHRRVKNCTVADVYCTRCNRLLGLKIVEDVPPMTNGDAKIWFALYRTELLFCTIDQTLHASNMQPWQPPGNN